MPPFDDLVRTTLTDLAEEAIPVDLTRAAVARATRRRTLTISLSAAAVVGAVLIGTPLAFAAAGHHAPPGPAAPASNRTPASTLPTGEAPNPSPPQPNPDPSPTQVVGIPPAPSRSAVPNSPVPMTSAAPAGPLPSPTQPAPTHLAPSASPRR